MILFLTAKVVLSRICPCVSLSFKYSHFPLLNEFEAVQRVEAHDGVLVLVVQHQPLCPRLAPQPLGQGAQLAPAEERVDSLCHVVMYVTCHDI